MDRVLTWHFPVGGNGASPTYYIETDCKPEAVRIYAEVAPKTGDLEVDIFDDGASIFNSHVPYLTSARPYRARTPNTWVFLPKGDTEELDAEDFIGGDIEAGSKVTCALGSINGAQNITVHLELSKMDEPDEVAE